MKDFIDYDVLNEMIGIASVFIVVVLIFLVAMGVHTLLSLA